MSYLFYQIFLSFAIFPMLYVCWKSDQVKNRGTAKKVMSKKLKRGAV